MIRASVSRRILLACIAISLCAADSQASVVTSVTGGTGFGTNGAFFNPGEGNFVIGPSGGGVQTIDLNLDVLQIMQPFTVNFTRASAGSPGNFDQLNFRITLRNSTSLPVEPIYQLVVSFSGAGIAFSDPPTPTPWSQFNGDTTVLFVGGAGGHSFELLPGATTSADFITFSMGSFLNNSFSLTFTANPEPSTLILSAVVCAAFAWLVIRRRRQALETALPVMAAA